MRWRALFLVRFHPRGSPKRRLEVKAWSFVLGVEDVAGDSTYAPTTSKAWGVSRLEICKASPLSRASLLPPPSQARSKSFRIKVYLASKGC